MNQLDVVTLFPDWFDWFRSQRHVGNAVRDGLELRTLNPRDHTPLSGGQVDDTPFGGGAGMVLRVDVMDTALRAFYNVDPVDLRKERRVIALTPGGRVLDDAYVDELAAEPAITLLCGRYEGFDERIRERVTEELSIGDYVLTGGEVPALVIVDAVARLIPGVVGDEQSVAEDSFSRGLLDFPQYTRPAEIDALRVPDVLMSGNHAEIRRWRKREAVTRTLQRRPDLLAGASLDEEEQEILKELRNERD